MCSAKRSSDFSTARRSGSTALRKATSPPREKPITPMRAGSMRGWVASSCSAIRPSIRLAVGGTRLWSSTVRLTPRGSKVLTTKVATPIALKASTQVCMQASTPPLPCISTMAGTGCCSACLGRLRSPQTFCGAQFCRRSRARSNMVLGV